MTASGTATVKVALGFLGLAITASLATLVVFQATFNAVDRARKRAVIVGETTGGGAHPVSLHRIADHFTISVPFARAINPVTQTNWEGVGVVPDVKVPASETLATALKLLTENVHP